MVRSRRYLTMPIVAAVLLALPAAAPASAAPAEFTGEVNFLIGEKSLEENDWAPVEDQGMIAVEMSWAGTDWPVHIATDIIGTAAQEDTAYFDPYFGPLYLDVTGSTIEMDFGVRKIWEIGNFHPYIGGGIGMIIGAIDVDFGYLGSDDESDAAIGPWAGGGMFWRLGSHFNLGFSLRWSQGDVEIAGVDVDAGGLQYGFLLGFGWPGK